MTKTKRRIPATPLLSDTLDAYRKDHGIKDNQPYFGDISKNTWGDAHDRARDKVGLGFPPDAADRNGHKPRELTEREFHRVL